MKRLSSYQWRLKSTVSAAGLYLGIMATTSASLAQSQAIQFDIPSQSLAQSLREYARLAGQQIIFTNDLLPEQIGKPLHGTYSPNEALAQLLSGTGLEADRTVSGAIMIRRERHGDAQVPGPVRVAQVNDGTAADASTSSPPPAPGGGVESITVSGFKASLEQALENKQNSISEQDSILAEDIAKFPDLDLAESIQRIPGVAMTTSNGEGDQLTVRGLSPLFTTVEINGVTSIATFGQATQAFDFNIFSSDLFTGITVHKSGEADLPEGALGAEVNLQTYHPIDHPGFHLTGSMQAGYNSMSSNGYPRTSLLVSDTFFGDRLGLSLAASYSTRNNIEVGSDSVGFQADNTYPGVNHSSPLVAGCVTNVPAVPTQCTSTQRFASVTVQGTGLPGTIPQTAGTVETAGAVPNGANYNAGALPNDYDVVNEAYRYRFPRYLMYDNEEQRMGVSGSLQYQVDEQTLFTVDALYAYFARQSISTDVTSPAFGINGTGSNLAPNGAPALKANTLGTGNINISNYTVNETQNNLTYLAATDVGLTSETSGSNSATRYSQITADLNRDFGPVLYGKDLKLDALLAYSQSDFVTPLSYLFKMDYDCTPATSATGTIAGCPGGVGGGAGTASQPFSVNYQGAQHFLPGTSLGNVDPTSTNGWFLSQFRDTPTYDYVSFRSAYINGTYELNDSIKFQFGADFKNFGYSTVELARTNGSTAAMDSFFPSSVENTPLSQVTSLYTLRGISVPAGTPTTYLGIDPQKMNSLFGVFNGAANNGTNTSLANYVWPTTSAASATCQTSGCSAWLLGPEQYLPNNGSVRQNIWSTYLMMDWDTKIGTVPFRGNIGGRYAETDQVAEGYSYNPSVKAVVPTTVPDSYHNFLPSMNAVLQPVDDFNIRFSAGYEMSRPQLNQMLPGASVTKSGTGPLTITSGNPLLKPYTDKAVDTSFEWYYDTGALFSVAFFYKHLDTLISNQTTNIPYEGNPFGLPDSLALAACGGSFSSFCNTTNTASFTYVNNQKGAPLYGTELNWQQPFSFLPDYWSNFGVLANVTFVQAEQTYLNTNGTVAAVADLINLSRTTYNYTLYYDDHTFQARISAAFRSKSVLAVNPGYNNDLTYNAPYVEYDASASYKITDNIELTFQAINLFNEPVVTYYDTVGQRTDDDDFFGREFYLGVHYTY